MKYWRQNMKDCIIELQEISDELYDEKKELQNLINQNLFQIEKINVYLKSLFEKEDTDFKVFSPRNIETVYGEQIEMNNKQKESLEAENVVYYKKLNILNKQLDRISRVINELKGISKEKSEDNDVVLEISKEKVEVSNDSSIKNESNREYLNHISHQIRNAVSILNMDMQRAKNELTSLANKIDME